MVRVRGRTLSIMCVLCMAVALLVPAIYTTPPVVAVPLAWDQVNADGFGFSPPGEMGSAFCMAEYDGSLYAGTINYTNENGCAVWRYDGGLTWTQVGFGGFGDTNNWAAYSMAVNDGLLYVGTENSSTGCEVWSYDGTAWAQVNTNGFGAAANLHVGAMVALDGTLYAATGNQRGGVPCRVWRYDGGTTWTQVNTDGFGLGTANRTVRSMAVYDGKLYAGTFNSTTGGGQVWRYDGPTTADWVQVDAAAGPVDTEVRCLQAWGGSLCAGTSGTDDPQIWQYDGSAWTNISPVWPDDYNDAARCMTVYNGDLIVGTGNYEGNGTQIMQYDGSAWEQVNESGFGDWTNQGCHSLCVFEGRLYAGVFGIEWGSPSNYYGATVWRYGLPTWYLPEGCTRDGFETWVLVENPNDAAAQVSLAFDTDMGEVVKPDLQDVAVPANSRISFNLNPYYYSYDVATRVTSTLPVVCESAMYGNGGQWGSESIGSDATAGAWYLAEGCTSPGYETWVLVQNPNDYEVRVNFSFHTDQGLLKPAEMQDLIMPAHTRASWNLADYYVSNTIATEVDLGGGGRGLRALHVRVGSYLGFRLHRGDGVVLLLVPGGGLYRRRLRHVGAGAESPPRWRRTSPCPS